MKNILFGAEAICMLIQGDGIDEVVHCAKEKEITLEVIEVDASNLSDILDKAVWWESWSFISHEHFLLLEPHSIAHG